MFSTKQSDVFYNDQTKEMFVCTVSSISADRCDGTSEIVYGAVPLIYKIDKNTNYKSRVYPKDLQSFSLSANSDLFAVTPTCPEGTNFDSITKPLINFNKTTSRYSVTFLGRYTSDSDGLGLNNFIFEDVNSYFHLLDSKIYIPKAKFTDDQFTFESGHLNSDLYIAGNTVRNGKPSWFNPSTGAEIERSPDYSIGPMHVQSTSSLGFNLILDQTNTTIDALTGDKFYPILYSGGFITYNPKFVAFDPEYTIRVDFRARSFNVPSPTAYGGTQSVGNSATRWVQQWAPAGAGEGFCLSFFKNPERDNFIIANGIGSTLGYAIADFSANEVAGTAHSTVGLFKRKNWNPNTGYTGNIGEGNIGQQGEGSPADSFLGVGFDIGGNFASTSEDKPGWFDGTTYTASPCSVGIRGSKFYDTQVLTSVDMSATAGAAVPMHTSAVSAQFVDYRVDLTNKGTKVTVYNKLTSETDYNTILELRLNVGVGTSSTAGEKYNAWKGFQDKFQIKNAELPPLNVGLSFTTSDKASQFELHKFEVTGVKVHKPWSRKLKEQPTSGGTVEKIDYLQESSKNLRKKLINVDINDPDDLVDVEMVIPAKQNIAKVVSEITDPEITLCDDNNPETIEQDVDIKITKISSNQIDKTIAVAESGHVPKIPGSVTTIKKVQRNITTDEITEPVVDDTSPPLITRLDRFCRSRITHPTLTRGKTEYPRYWFYKTNPIVINNKTYYIWIDGIEHEENGSLNTSNILFANLTTIENRFITDVLNNPSQSHWVLHQYVHFDPTLPWSELYNSDVDKWFFFPLLPDNEEFINNSCKVFDIDPEDGGDDDKQENTSVSNDVAPGFYRTDCEFITVRDLRVKYTIDLLGIKLSVDNYIPTNGVATAGGVAASDVIIKIKENRSWLNNNRQNCYFVSVNANAKNQSASLEERKNEVVNLLKTELGDIITNF